MHVASDPTPTNNETDAVTAVPQAQDRIPDSGSAEATTADSQPQTPEAQATPPPPSGSSASDASLSCQPDTCLIDGKCIDAASPRPNSLCEYCDPVENPNAWTARAEGTPCDDEVFCNGTGHCGGGALSGRCVTGERPCPEHGDVCRTCDEGTRRCGYATTEWTWTDPTSNLEWWLRSTLRLTLEDARNFCSELLLCGRNDWHLATIDELRTLVRRCPATEPQGACGITDTCTSYECSNDSCAGCGSRDSRTDWYCAREADVAFPNVMSGTPVRSEAILTLNCSTGGISTIGAGNGPTFGEGRCVRNAN